MNPANGALPPAADFSVTETLRGKRLLFTGATGFVGKVALSMILTKFPDIGRLYVLARPGVSTGADARLFDKVIPAPPFDPLRAKLGPDFERFIHEKCEAVGGDVSKPFCGFPEELLNRLTGQVDVLVNCAGLVDFNPTIESAINANALGALHVAQTAKRLGAALVHVSTCYVAGNETGIIAEDENILGFFPKRDEWRGQTFDPMVEIDDCKRHIERIKAHAEDKAMQSEFRAKALDRLHAEGRDETDEKALRTGSMRERKLWVGDQLVKAGLERSLHWGWPNTYTYTKSLGDQVIDGFSRREGLDFAIVRPAIVESALRFPFPGWNEGFTTTAPLTFLAIKGHRAYVAREGHILDVIPCDHIAAGLISVTAAILAKRHKKVYHLGSSDSNPLLVTRSIELSGLYRRRYYKRKKLEEGESEWKNELLARIEAQIVTKESYLSTSAPQIAKWTRNVSQWLTDAKPSWGGPRLGATIERVQNELDEVARKADLAHSMFDLFMPFLWENNYIFQTKNIRALQASMVPEDRARIPWDPDSFDWLDYWLDIHLVGLEKWVYPNLEDELGARGKKKGVPVYRDLWELIEARARKHAGKVALRFLRDGQDDRYTYGQLRDRAVRAAFFLQASGVDPADRVLLMGENRPEWPMAYFGILKAGATAVPLDHQSTREEVENVCRTAGAKIAVLSQKVLEKLQLEPGTQLGGATVVPLQDLFHGKYPACDEARLASREPGELASLIFTSGTTGKPKGVMLSHRNFTSLVQKMSQVFDLGERDGMLSVLPLHHTFEFSSGLLMPLAVGAEIAYLEELNGDRLAEAFQTGRITAMVGVPALWQLLLRRIEGNFSDAGIEKPAKALQTAVRKADDKIASTLLGKAVFLPVHRRFGGRLRYLISGGSAMPPDVYDAFKGMGFAIYEGYGLTGSSPVLTVQAKGDAAAGHVGKPLPGVEVRIHEPDAEGVGEVIAKGPNVMVGYWNDPEATAAVLREGWLYTGDLGKFDEEGHLCIVGRKKDVIIDANGKNVYPDELEELYREHVNVKELSIVGLVDEAGGEKIACLLVPEFGTATDKAKVRETIEAHVREVSLKLPYYKRIKVLHLQDAELPKTAKRSVKRKQVVDELARLESKAKAAAGKKGLVADGDTWLYDLVARVSEQPRDKITPDARLERDLGFDSLMFTELSTALEEAGVRPSAAEEVLGVTTIADLSRKVIEWRRGGRSERAAITPASDSRKNKRERERSLWGNLLDVVQPAIDAIPVVGDAVALARADGLPELFEERPKRKAALRRGTKKGEVDGFELPEPMVAAGRGLLREGQKQLYDALFHSKVYGRANIPSHVNFLVASNHSSHLDMGLIKHALGAHGEQLVALAARDYFFSDRWRRTYFENFTNLIPMDRHGSLRESLRLASKSLAMGKNLLIFPEGTRAQDGKIAEFKPSIGYLALTNRTGILPICLKGTYDALPKGAILPKDRNLAAHFGPFLSYEELVARTQGLPRSEQHREVSRIVEDAVRALMENRRLTPRRGPAPHRPARTTIDVSPAAEPAVAPAHKHGHKHGPPAGDKKEQP